jgi:hypothetical protein
VDGAVGEPSTVRAVPTQIGGGRGPETPKPCVVGSCVVGSCAIVRLPSAFAPGVLAAGPARAAARVPAATELAATDLAPPPGPLHRHPRPRPRPRPRAGLEASCATAPKPLTSIAHPCKPRELRVNPGPAVRALQSGSRSPGPSVRASLKARVCFKRQVDVPFMGCLKPAISKAAQR